MSRDAEQVAFAGVTGQLELLRSGRLARIDRLDGRLDASRAVCFERALDEARTADEARVAGQERLRLGLAAQVHVAIGPDRRPSL